MLLAVRLDDEPCIVDVGFGGQTPTGVLRLQADVAQDTPHGPFRLLQDAAAWRLQSCVQGDWRPVYRFDLQPAYRVDYEVSNYYLSTHPDSHFVTRLVAAQPRSEEHTSELQSLMRISYAVFCLKKKKKQQTKPYIDT